MRKSFHPKAFLSQRRNVKRGLFARTRIIFALEKTPLNVKDIAKATGLGYKVVLHHLRLLQIEKVVIWKGSRPHVWQLTGMGQQRLSNTAAH